MRTAWILTAVLTLSLGLVTPASADEGPITITLRSGEKVEGTLLGFGERVFKVQVGDRVREIAEAEVASLSFPKPKPKPSRVAVHRPPVDVKATQAIGAVELRWQDSIENEYVVVRSYQVMRASQPGGPWRRIAETDWDDAKDPRALRDEDAAAGDQYFYKVVSVGEVDGDNPVVQQEGVALPAAQREQESAVVGPVSPKRGWHLRVLSVNTESTKLAQIRVWRWNEASGSWERRDETLKVGERIEDLGLVLKEVQLQHLGERYRQVATFEGLGDARYVIDDAPLSPSLGAGDPGDGHALLVRGKGPATSHQEAIAGLLESERPISVNLLDTTFSDAIRFLRDVTGQNIVVDPSVDPEELTVLLKLRNQPLKQFFPLLLELTKLKAEPYAGALRFRSPDAALWYPTGLPETGPIAEALRGQRWTIDFEGVPLLRAFDLISERSGLNIVLSPLAVKTIEGEEVAATFTARDLTLKDLITLVSRSSATLCWRVKNGVILVQSYQDDMNLALDGCRQQVSFKGELLFRAFSETLRRFGVPYDALASSSGEVTLEMEGTLREVLEAFKKSVPNFRWKTNAEGRLWSYQDQNAPSKPTSKATAAELAEAVAKSAAGTRVEAAGWALLCSKQDGRLSYALVPRSRAETSLELADELPWKDTLQGLAPSLAGLREGEQVFVVRGTLPRFKGMVFDLPEPAALTEIRSAARVRKLELYVGDAGAAALVDEARRASARSEHEMSRRYLEAALLLGPSLTLQKELRRELGGVRPAPEAPTRSRQFLLYSWFAANDFRYRLVTPGTELEAEVIVEPGKDAADLGALRKQLKDVPAGTTIYWALGPLTWVEPPRPQLPPEERAATVKRVFAECGSNLLSGDEAAKHLLEQAAAAALEDRATALDYLDAALLVAPNLHRNPDYIQLHERIHSPPADNAKTQTSAVEQSYGEKRSQTIDDLRRIVMAVWRYQRDHQLLPLTFDELWKGQKKYLPNLPQDPWGNPYVYKNKKPDIDFDLRSLGADGVADGEGEGEDLSVREHLDKRYLPKSMKGWELYGWREQGVWQFTLTLGTNRAKSVAEIKAADDPIGDGLHRLRLHSKTELVQVLAWLPLGTVVDWPSRPPGLGGELAPGVLEQDAALAKDLNQTLAGRGVSVRAR